MAEPTAKISIVHSSKGNNINTRKVWKRFTRKSFKSSGKTVNAGFYFKLIYGLIGTGFLLFIAFSGGAPGDRFVDEKLAPNSWYWSWLDVEDPKLIIPEYTFDDEFPDDIFDQPSGKSDDNEPDVATSWGSDSKGRSIRNWMGDGATDYILLGMASAIIGLFGAICWATLIEWTIRPKLPYPHEPVRWRKAISESSNSLLQAIDNIPKLLLLIVIFGGFGEFSKESFTLSMSIFLIFGSTSLFRDRIRAYLVSEYYLYTIELGMPSFRIFSIHLIFREIVPLFRVQLPFMLSTFIMYEATVSYLSFSSGDFSSWGYLIRDNRNYVEFTPWAYWIPLLSILVVVSSLYLLGDALRELKSD